MANGNTYDTIAKARRAVTVSVVWCAAGGAFSMR